MNPPDLVNDLIRCLPGDNQSGGYDRSTIAIKRRPADIYRSAGSVPLRNVALRS